MNYRKDHIPRNTPCKRRPGYAMAATTLTIHNTGNESSNAAGERSWLTNPFNVRQASYHIVVDEREAVECLPLNESAWHSGDGSGSKSGNRTSIGIEICESGNYAQTLENAVTLVAGMLKERGWGVDRLRRHYDWSGKICPRLMYDGGKWTGWAQFKTLVNLKLNEEEKDMKVDKASTVINGNRLGDDSVLIEGRVYVPLAAVSKALGASVNWNNVTKTVTLTTKGAK